MKKTYLACALAIGILLTSAAAFGTIIPDEGYDGSGSPTSTSVSAFADGNDPDNSDYGEGYNTYTTDTAGYFTWSCQWDVYVLAWADQVEGSVSAYAEADTNTSGGGKSVNRSVNGTSWYWSDPPQGHCGPFTDYFDAWSGVFAANYAEAEGHVASGSGSTAGGDADASATCSMW